MGGIVNFPDTGGIEAMVNRGVFWVKGGPPKSLIIQTHCVGGELSNFLFCSLPF